MGVTTFAAIYIGSYEVSLKVFEISGKKRIHTVDFVRSRVELGKASPSAMNWWTASATCFMSFCVSWRATRWTIIRRLPAR